MSNGGIVMIAVTQECRERRDVVALEHVDVPDEQRLVLGIEGAVERLARDLGQRAPRSL